MSNPVSKQPGGGSTAEFFPYNNQWKETLFGSFKPCPRSAYACLCGQCFVGQLADRLGEHFITCCIVPGSLLALRTKVRTVYKIEGTMIKDCLATSCCVGPCAAMQIEHELNHRGVPAKRAK
ncbi:unnamed protein product [Adineta ricciae]|uniref:Uncharacterized protein n=1 Tax=Adineta ricciae TaxID=249248 RepID=A0A814C2L4_ADIRI|nr:unnamed protein product [Adineta ricciae]CAF1279979.1 unnamed protein product [Adineta ricciae]